MFFIFSKLLSFLIKPLTIVVLLMLAGLIVRTRRWRAGLVSASFVLLLFFSNPYVSKIAARAWETEATYNDAITYDAAIVLTGMLYYDQEYKQRDFGASVDRITESLSLFREGKVRNILISGGSGKLTDTGHRESVLLKDFLTNACGLPDSVVLIDSLSRNTYENAVESGRIVKTRNFKSLLLITSAGHMRRAEALFAKQNVAVDTYPVDRESAPEYHPEGLFIPSVEAFEDWTNLFHEVVGTTVYKLLGYL